jgi:signal transduction histidine kinase/ActR/RegA family two-component response regulator
MHHFIYGNFYYLVMLFTLCYALCFIVCLGKRLSYSRSARSFVWFLLAVGGWAIKDSLAELLVPQLWGSDMMGRVLVLLGLLKMLVPWTLFVLLRSSWQTLTRSTTHHPLYGAVERILLLGAGVVVLAGLIEPATIFAQLGLSQHPFSHYDYRPGVGLLFFGLLLMVGGGLPAVRLIALSWRTPRSESFLMGMGALISLSVVLVSNFLSSITVLQELPRLGCLGMVVLSSFTFFGIMRYGRQLAVERVMQQQEAAQSVVESMEALVDEGSEQDMFRRIGDNACEISCGVASCILAFDEAQRSYTVRTLAARSGVIKAAITERLPLKSGSEHQLWKIAGLERQLRTPTMLQFSSLDEFFGDHELSQAELGGVRQIISYPIFYEKRVWGALVLLRDEAVEETALFRMFGIQCSLVLRFSHQIQELERIRELEEQLHQAQKMEAIGQLAGGIAHDFNNMLSGISGYAQLIKRRFVDRVPELKMYADAMLSASRSATDLTDKLLAFARKGKYQSIAIDLHETVDAVIELLRHSIDRRITIERRFEAAQHAIVGDPTQIQNLVLNLALNARNAMPAGGVLSFGTTTHFEESDRTIAGQYAVTAGAYLVLSVVDTGTGMDAEVRKRIFEPFFTTGSMGKGTGLGLASVYGTVRNHGGLIEVDSELGKGSTFRVFLPLAKSSVQIPKPQQTQELIRGSGTVLVVDDEEMVCALAKEILLFLGYQVVTCSDGVEGVEYYRQHHRQIDACILDVMMPRMDGYETFRQMRLINPEAKVIIMTGYSLNEDTHHSILVGVSGFIKKPFETAELSALLHAVITGDKSRLPLVRR